MPFAEVWHLHVAGVLLMREQSGISRGGTRVRTGCLALLALAILQGCSTQQVDLWPLFYTERDPTGLEQGAAGTRTTEVVYPIFSLQNSPERRYHAVRPLYNYESRTDGTFTQIQFIWPLGLYRRQEDREKLIRFIPLFHHGSMKSTATGEWQTQGFVFPLIYWGDIPDEGSYFGFFPLGGMIRHMFIQRFRFVLFPIWSDVQDKDYHRTDVLWPIISWGGTPDGRREILRIWPFYVHKAKAGDWEQNWAPWPLVLWGKENMDGECPRSYWGIFPFYVSKVSEDRTGGTVAYDRRILYLLFVRRKDTRDRYALSSWAVLWPFTNFEHGVSRSETRIWPLYWRTDQLARERDDYLWRRYRVLWPIIWVTRDHRHSQAPTRDIVVAPLYWDYAKSHPDGTHQRAVTFWPLYTFKRDTDGAVHHWVLSHGWHDVTDGWKRNLRAFFDIFQYHEGPGPKHNFRLLWRLIDSEHDGTWRRFEVNPLFTYERDEGYGRWSALFGIISRQVQGEKRGWRILYIPFGDRIERKPR